MLIFGVAVLGAFVWNRSDDRQIARRVSQPGAARCTSARITKAQGCYPATTGPWAADGLRFRLGYECYVASGELEITYDTGVKVTLQGPAWYEVNSAGSGTSPWHGSSLHGGATRWAIAGPAGCRRARNRKPSVIHPAGSPGSGYKPGGGVQLDGR